MATSAFVSSGVIRPRRWPVTPDLHVGGSFMYAPHVVMTRFDVRQMRHMFPTGPTSLLGQESDTHVDAMSTHDVLNGVVLAFCLAFVISFLQRKQSSPNFILWRTTDDSVAEALNDITTIMNDDGADESPTNSTRVVFDAESWREMSRPENYIFYNTKIRRKLRSKEVNEKTTTPPASWQEKKWVLIGLLTIFIPIFGFEFFLALSRQFLCGGNPLTQSAWANELCSPHFR